MPNDESFSTPRMHQLGGGGEGNLSLKDAFSMFNNGLAEFAQTQSLLSAHQQVQDINAQSLNEADKTAALNQVAQGLTLKMSSLGTPVSAIKEAVSAFKPKEQPLLQSGTEVATYGTPQQKSDFLEMQDKLADIKNKYDLQDPEVAQQKKDRAERQDNDQHVKFITGIQKNIDDTQIKGRGPMGILLQKRDRIADLNGLLSGAQQTPEEFNKLAMTNVRELVTNLDSVFRGGVATEGGVEGLVPNNVQTKLARLNEIAQSKPSVANQGEYIRLYADIIDRTSLILDAQIKAAKKNSLASTSSVIKKNPKYSEDIDTLSRQHIGEGAKIVNGKVVFEGDAAEEDVANKLNTLTTKYKDDPNAANALEKLQENPAFWGALMRNKNLGGKVRMFQSKLRNKAFGEK